MEAEQTSTNEATVQAVSEATWVAIQAMAMDGVKRTQHLGPKLGCPMMKQLHCIGAPQTNMLS